MLLNVNITSLIFSAFGEFTQQINFRYLSGRDLISYNDPAYDWTFNFHLFGRTSSSLNAIKLNNYGSLDGGEWKSYVFLAGNPDPLTFASIANPNRFSFYIPGRVAIYC